MAQTGTVVFFLKISGVPKIDTFPLLTLSANVFVSQIDLSFVMHACQTVLGELVVHQ